MTHHTDAERAEFEYWARNDFYACLASVGDTWNSERGMYSDAAHHMAFHAWQAARRAPAVQVPQGWKLVPKEATPEMLEQVWYLGYDEMRDAYCVLVAAAPQPPEAAPENIREGAPYDNPAFEQLARDMGVWGTPQAALCAQFWLAALAQRVPLSDDQISALFDVHHADLAAGKIKEVSFLTYARVIEAAHGITQEKQG